MREPAKILIVDDDPMNLRLMESILGTQGYAMIRAQDGQEALDKIALEEPSLVLLDVMMPRMSGFEVCEKVRSQHQTQLLPVIMITALNSLEEKIQALEIGADDFLSKPVNKTELLAKIRSVLRVKSLHDQVEQTRQELELKNRELIRMEEFKERVVQMVVHDLKNPLSGIMGNLQLLEMQDPASDPERVRRHLSRTQQSAKQLMSMILNILDVARMEERKLSLHLETLQPAELISRCLREVQGLATREEVTLHSAVTNPLPALVGDPDLLGRTLANLVNNALKHTPSGGHVEVGADLRNDIFRFWVKDTGEGIAPDLLPKVFERFVVGDKDWVGMRKAYDTGLGLTFCKMAVEAHGGSISANSELGQGSIFAFTIPLRPADERRTPDLLRAAR